MPTFLPSWKGTTGSSSACRMSREQEMCFTLREVGGRKALDGQDGLGLPGCQTAGSRAQRGSTSPWCGRAQIARHF